MDYFLEPPMTYQVLSYRYPWIRWLLSNHLFWVAKMSQICLHSTHFEHTNFQPVILQLYKGKLLNLSAFASSSNRSASSSFSAQIIILMAIIDMTVILKLFYPSLQNSNPVIFSPSQFTNYRYSNTTSLTLDRATEYLQ